MASETETQLEETLEQAADEVTFYAWVEKSPSSEVIHISGGGRVKDANGTIMNLPDKEVRFNAGILHTGDPEVIAVIRKFMRKGAKNISENKEDYLRAVLPMERMAERHRQQIADLQEQTITLSRDKNRLMEQLKKKEAKSA